MAIKIVWRSYKTGKKQDITKRVTKVTWTGSDTQAARTLSFSCANNPYDKNFFAPALRNGDTIYFYHEKTLKFVGRVINREQKSEIGELEFTANDYLYNLLQSEASYRFKNKTPEFITRAVCKDFKVKTGGIISTKQRIAKYLPNGMSPYNIILKAYQKVHKTTGKQYMIRMNGTKLEVIEKGKIVQDLRLSSKRNLTSAEYSEDASGVIDRVAIYSDKGKKIGSVQNTAWIKRFGVIQGSVEKEKGKSAKKAAKNTLKGVDRNASVTAIGVWACIAGRGIKIYDAASGLTATYWIKSDQHEWSNGYHTMTLDLTFKNVMESVEYSEASASKSSSTGSGTKTTAVVKKTVKAKYTAYYPANNSMEGGYKDAMGHKLVPAKRTCAAPRSIAFNTKIIPKGTGSYIDGTTYKVTDRGGAIKFQNGRYHFDILMESKAAAERFGIKYGEAQIIKEVKQAGNISKKADRVAEIAEGKIGKVRYVFGARNVPGGKADCSGFTCWCFKQIGRNIGSDTIAQAKKGTKIPRSQIKRGDLIIFQGTYRSGPSHVGIATSNKTFVHCSSGKKTVVKSTLTGYYLQHYHSARRIV